MDDKMFELLTKMYSDFSRKFENIDKRFDDVDKRFDGIDTRLDRLEKEQSRQGVILENDIKNDIKALYDGYKQTYEKVTVIEKGVMELSAKVDKQEVEIKVIKGGR